MKEELESNDEELNMLIGDKTSMISPANLQMPPPNQYLRPDPGQETSYSGTTESYSHSDETYISTDVTDPEPNSSPASTPSSTPELERRNPFPRRTSNRHKNPRYIQSSSATSSSTSDAQCDLQDDDFFMVDEFEAKTLTSQISRGRPFPTQYFERMVPELVDAIPLDIDGTQLYQIKTKKNQLTKVTHDLRHFQMLTSSREGFVGERRIGTCQGSFVCCNKQCPFVRTSKNSVPNKVSWRFLKVKRNIRICNICDQVAQHEGCGARKLIEYDYDTQLALVYHLGNHTCSLQLDQIKRNQVLMKRLQEKNPTGSAKEVALCKIGLLIESGEMDLAVNEAENSVDHRAAKRQMEKLVPTAGHDHNSFDAVGIIKQTTDTRDKFYIYRIGNRNLNGGSDYVFKSSRKMGEMALLMDVEGPENILQLENAYFDAMHTRVYGFKTFAMWLIHPAMKQILRLASVI